MEEEIKPVKVPKSGVVKSRPVLLSVFCLFSFIFFFDSVRPLFSGNILVRVGYQSIKSVFCAGDLYEISDPDVFLGGVPASFIGLYWNFFHLELKKNRILSTRHFLSRHCFHAIFQSPDCIYHYCFIYYTSAAVWSFLPKTEITAFKGSFFFSPMLCRRPYNIKLHDMLNNVNLN
jgi:hypothetical protein